MKKVTFLNHASVLIQNNDNIILTDPWYKKPAFGSWLSIPPCVYHPAYFMALAKTNPKFTIVISHGHDDHFDDDFLAAMPENTTVLLPKYDSIGPRKRLERCGIKNIIEFDSNGVQHNGVEYKSFIFKDVSMDDAFITIATEDCIVAHGNDNWQELPDDVLNIVKTDFAKYDKQDTLFMSQTNMADGFPLIYENYTPEEKAFLAKRRQDNMIISSVKNALSVDAGAFLSYAGMAIPFIKGQENLLDEAYCKSLDYVNKLLVENNVDNSIVLDMVPGDSYDFNKVDKLFGKNYFNHEEIKQASVDFYKKYEWINNCDTYQESMKLSADEKGGLLDLFLGNFKEFVLKKYGKTEDFHGDVFNIKLTFKDSDVEKTISFNDDAEIHATFTFDVVPMEKILTGKLNWECCYVGYESKVHVNGDHNIGAMIRWLTMYGYVYQQRIYPNRMVEVA
jgi:hypothetical protein